MRIRCDENLMGIFFQEIDGGSSCEEAAAPEQGFFRFGFLGKKDLKLLIDIKPYIVDPAETVADAVFGDSFKNKFFECCHAAHTQVSCPAEIQELPALVVDRSIDFGLKVKWIHFPVKYRQ